MSGEAEDKGIVSLRQPVVEEQGHVCEICGRPDHRDCGCEAKKRAAKQPMTQDAPADEKNEAVLEQLSNGVAQLLLENREAQLAATRDIVEQLKIIADQLKQLVMQKEIYETIKTGGPHGN